jgi:hypothetical protein
VLVVSFCRAQKKFFFFLFLARDDKLAGMRACKADPVLGISVKKIGEIARHRAPNISPIWLHVKTAVKFESV